MNTASFLAFHIVTAGAKGKDVSATILVSLEAFIGWFNKSNKIKDVALTTGDFSDDVVAPNNKPDEPSE